MTTTDRLTWARKAHELKFVQLESARRQAEMWRTGLAGVTALLGAVVVVKGRDNVAALAPLYQRLVFAFFAIALVAFVVATFTVLRAASGEPGDSLLLNAEELEAWSAGEVGRIHRSVKAARWLTVFGLCTVGAGTATAWIAPANNPLVRVVSPNGEFCGKLLQLADGSMRIGSATSYDILPITTAVRVEMVDSC